MDNKPIGLSLGPVNTLAKNPYNKIADSQGELNIRVIIDKTKTINATVLAAYSLTGFGKFNRLFIVVSFIRKYCCLYMK